MNSQNVSILMNTYNGGKFIKEAIESIINQTYSNWELIIWDNLSEDNTSEIVKSFNDQRIKYFIADSHTNLGKARSTAIKKCTGQYISFLDSDDLWLPNKLEKQIPYFENKDIGMVASDSIFFSNNKDIRNLYKDGYPKDGYIFNDLLRNYYLGIETIIIRSSVLNKIPYDFDIDLHCISDFDLFIRIFEVTKTKILPFPTAKWRIHENNETFTFPKKFIEETNIWIKKIEKTTLITNKYQNSWEVFKKNAKINEAEFFFLSGKRFKTYQIIKKNIFYSKKSIIIFLINFLPFSRLIYKTLKSIKNKI